MGTVRRVRGEEKEIGRMKVMTWCAGRVGVIRRGHL